MSTVVRAVHTGPGVPVLVVTSNAALAGAGEVKSDATYLLCASVFSSVDANMN